MREAVELLARKEGIILDPVYTGKAMAGLLDLIQKGLFRQGDVVVFIHTGGIPGLFASEQLATFQM
jgi:1-aminocyclopropane-1-carboxylate deaminase/D-cysteine desulfhydrase-like pyridoxal-dependent ACC family enzyme